MSPAQPPIRRPWFAFSPRWKAIRPPRAFSLLELLVAVALTAVLGVVILRILEANRGAIRLSRSLTDADEQARLVFGRLHLDLAAMVRREDADFLADNTGAPASGNLRLITAVMSEGAAANGNRRFSLVSYEVRATAANDNRLCVTRAARPADWQDPILGADAEGAPASLADGSAFPVTLAPSDYLPLAPGAIRLVVGFQLRPDGAAATLRDGSLIAKAAGQIVYSPPVRSATNPQVDHLRISNLVIGLVALNESALENLGPSEVNELAGAFPLPNPGQLPCQAWDSQVTALINSSSAIPLQTRQALRVYQRFFPLHPFGRSSSP
jgi:prepilin-type N-terminal cleavage/methylation domain-containing protein